MKSVRLDRLKHTEEHTYKHRKVTYIGRLTVD